MANVGGFGRCVAARVEIPARPGRVADARTLARVRDEALSPVTRAALLSAGVDAGRLYAHQCAGIEAALAGADVVVATGTASGKSAVYNATALERLFADPDASAIYLFPTKALARDQLDALGRMLEGAEAHRRRAGDARENNSRAPTPTAFHARRTRSPWASSTGTRPSRSVSTRATRRASW